MIDSKEALKQLKEGNKRFVSGVQHDGSPVNKIRDQNITQGQAPFAIVLGCSDSRVPAEIVFDQGLGDLFVIRVAGNIVAPSQIGSVEFAAEKFGSPLVVVLGHTHCGAVEATIEELSNPSSIQSSNVISIVKRIRPAIAPLFYTELRAKPEELLRASVRANIMAATNQLRQGSHVLEALVEQGKLEVVGAEYDIKTGEVEFIDWL